MESNIMKDIRKALVKHFLDIIMLGTLRYQSPLGGYDFSEIIFSRFNFVVSSGTIYSILYRLERKGLVHGETKDGKRVYALTEKGNESINSILQSKKEIVEFVETIFKSQ